jgi:hypothetical protein
MTGRVQSATCTEADGTKMMIHMLHRYAYAPEGSEVEISIGDIFGGPDSLGDVAVILTITGVRAIFPIAHAVSFLHELQSHAAQYREREGWSPPPIEHMVKFAGQILGAVEEYHAGAAARRARAH